MVLADERRRHGHLRGARAAHRLRLQSEGACSLSLRAALQLIHVVPVGVAEAIFCACDEVRYSAADVCLQSDVYSLGLIMFELYNVFTTEMERRHCLYQARKGNIPDSFKQQWRLQVGAN